ncbi:MAG: tryptophan-rich sensory protein [Sphingomonas sp.]|nr:tryptophan-rich sensory protein [Sphingomonas sp.]
MANRTLSPLSALAISAGTAALAAWIGSRDSPTPEQPDIQNWYRSLDKPGFTPPDAAFGVAWTAIQIGLASGAYRLLRTPGGPGRDRALALWAVNEAAIAGWSAIFFRARLPGAGALASAAMLGSGAAYVRSAAKVDRPAAAAGAPLVAWLGFATVLASEIWRRNRGARRIRR